MLVSRSCRVGKLRCGGVKDLASGIEIGHLASCGAVQAVRLVERCVSFVAQERWEVVLLGLVCLGGLLVLGLVLSLVFLVLSAL